MCSTHLSWHAAFSQVFLKDHSQALSVGYWMGNGCIDTGSYCSAVRSPSKIVFRGWLTVELIPKCYLKYHLLLSTEDVASLIHPHWFVSLSKTKRWTKPQYQAFSNVYSAKCLCRLQTLRFFLWMLLLVKGCFKNLMCNTRRGVALAGIQRSHPQADCSVLVS